MAKRNIFFVVGTEGFSEGERTFIIDSLTEEEKKEIIVQTDYQMSDYLKSEGVVKVFVRNNTPALVVRALCQNVGIEKLFILTSGGRGGYSLE